MSDTPIDQNLTEKASTRKPSFMAERISEFREEYNASIRDSFPDEESAEPFILDSESDARRRLLDMGMAQWVDNGAPSGFAFDPDDYLPPDSDLACPECDEDDPWMFRLGVTFREATEEGESASIDFDKVRCASCGGTFSLNDVARSQPAEFSF